MESYETLRSWVQLAEWVLLAAAAVHLWHRRRDAASSWLAATFASLAIVVIAGMALGSDEEAITGAMFWLVKLLIAVIALFPYLLYRFIDSIAGRKVWMWRLAHLLTSLVIATSVVLPSFPEQDAARPWWMNLWITFFLGQWVILLGHVAWQLWRSGRDLPAVARRRMRTMGAGALVLAAVLAVSGTNSSDEITAERVVLDIATVIAGPLFLFGFAPPGFLRAIWRRREEAHLREMEIGLVKAVSREEIADALLPAVVDLFGGQGAALIDPDGNVVGQRGIGAARLEALQAQVSVASDHYEALEVGDARVIPMETGWLVVLSGAFTPFFETEELRMLSASAVLADLALGRAKLYELETQSREAMRDFVAIASHDLRTPVTVIQGFSQLLDQQWDIVGEDRKKDFVSAINRQVLALDRLIRDLLTVSKLDVNELDLAPRPVDVVEAAKETVQTLAGDTPIEVRGDDCPLVLADPDHVARMLQNYVKNALVYGRPPYAIEIAGNGRWVTVSVRDNGVGVPEDFVPHLFEKFARVDKKKSKAVQGTGLGLSIVRGLARANGGEAWYEPNGSGNGACFAFRLPRVTETPSSDSAVDELAPVELKGTA
jgi:signal transduction histidine kinase